MSQLPVPLMTLAVWPTLNSLIFMLRSAGIAYSEVVIALLDHPDGRKQLRRFAMTLSLVLSAPILILCLTPLIDVWFLKFIGLKPEMAQLGKSALWFALFLPAITTWGCYFEGILVHAKRSNSVTEAVIFFTSTLFIFLYLVVKQQSMPGLNAAVCAMTLGSLAQTLWLWWRSRNIPEDHSLK
jgi:Na+-driven multidrug efflux pump